MTCFACSSLLIKTHIRSTAMVAFFFALFGGQSFATQPISKVERQTLDRVETSQSELKDKIEKYDRALSAIQAHLEKAEPAAPSKQPVSTPTPISEVTFTLSPESQKPAATSQPPLASAVEPGPSAPNPPPTPLPAPSEIWYQTTGFLLFVFSVGLFLFGGLGWLFWKRQKPTVSSPLFQAAASRYLPLENQLHPVYRFYVAQAQHVLKKGIELRSTLKQRPPTASLSTSLSDHAYGRWILGTASFEDESNLAESVSKRIMKTFPLEKCTASNFGLLRDATLAVLRGQGQY